jgi:hypothetical protein
MYEALYEAGYSPVYEKPSRVPYEHVHEREQELLRECEAKLRDCTSWDDIMMAVQ